MECLEKLYSIGEASKILGVHKITIHRWHKNHQIFCYFTPGGHRRFPESELFRIIKKKFPHQTAEISSIKPIRVAIYARVSSQKQKEAGNLNRQLERIIKYAKKKNYKIIECLKEVGSGLNENRQKLKKIFKLIRNRLIDVIIVEYKDRLTRFGFNYIEAYANSFNIGIEVINKSEKKEPMQELVEDMLSLIASFAARLYGHRSSRKKK
ncbi:MAG: IS607 family transposase [Candidatus Helarchaeota archaeon]